METVPLNKHSLGFNPPILRDNELGVICYAVALCYTMEPTELANYVALRALCFNYNLNDGIPF